MSRNPYVKQNPRRCDRRIQHVGVGTPIYRRSQHHFDMIKHNISDGVSSSTGLFDESFSPGSVDYDGSSNPFSARADKFDLANALLDSGGSKRDVTSVASTMSNRTE